MKNKKAAYSLAVGLVVCCLGAGMTAIRARADGPVKSRGQPGPAGMQINEDQSTVSILDGDRMVLRYRFGDVPWKPCVDQLFSPSGVQVLRDSPPDHKHHHALMFAVTVDGVNFWEENSPKFGKEKHVRLCRDPSDMAAFGEDLDWVGPGSDVPLMIEHRTLSVAKPSQLGATLLTWTCRLQAPPGKDSVKITGNHYHGLGMRFVASMDQGGRFFNADDTLGEIVRGDERLTPTKWCAFTASAKGKPVTVALFDDPRNVRYPARMFSMLTTFAYLAATRNEWKEPLVVNADKPLELNYGVAVWDGEVDKAAVEKLYERWLHLPRAHTSE